MFFPLTVLAPSCTSLLPDIADTTISPYDIQQDTRFRLKRAIGMLRGGSNIQALNSK